MTRRYVGGLACDALDQHAAQCDGFVVCTQSSPVKRKPLSGSATYNHAHVPVVDAAQQVRIYAAQTGRRVATGTVHVTRR